MYGGRGGRGGGGGGGPWRGPRPDGGGWRGGRGGDGGGGFNRGGGFGSQVAWGGQSNRGRGGGGNSRPPHRGHFQPRGFNSGGPPPRPWPPMQQQQQQQHEIKRENSDVHCDPCNETLPHDGAFRNHLMTNVHQENAGRFVPKQEPREQPQQGQKRPFEAADSSTSYNKQCKYVEDEPEFNESFVLLDWYNSDLNLEINAQDFCSAKARSDKGFGYLWAGVRATYGVTRGRVCFEVAIDGNQNVNHLTMEPNPHVLRCGWSTNNSSLQLGTEPLSFGFGGTGKASVNNRFRDYGRTFGVGDVIGCYLDLTVDPAVILYTVNGFEMGVAYRVSHQELQGQALYPHIMTKNQNFTVNFGQMPGPMRPQVPGFVPIGQMDIKDGLVRGSMAPSTREECELIVMVGLPGAGKTTWTADYVKKNPDKKYNILGTNTLIDQMKVMGLKRQANYSERFEMLIEKCSECFNDLVKVASKRRRNYIIDQTNVYPTARQRKIRDFAGFKSKMVVVVPDDVEYKRRVQLRAQEMGKEVPEDAVLEMKANFVLPEFEEAENSQVFYVAQDPVSALNLVQQYNAEAMVMGKDMKSGVKEFIKKNMRKRAMAGFVGTVGQMWPGLAEVKQEQQPGSSFQQQQQQQQQQEQVQTSTSVPPNFPPESAALMALANSQVKCEDARSRSGSGERGERLRSVQSREREWSRDRDRDRGRGWSPERRWAGGGGRSRSRSPDRRAEAPWASSGSGSGSRESTQSPWAQPPSSAAASGGPAISPWMDQPPSTSSTATRDFKGKPQNEGQRPRDRNREQPGLREDQSRQQQPFQRQHHDAQRSSPFNQRKEGFQSQNRPDAPQAEHQFEGRQHRETNQFQRPPPAFLAAQVHQEPRQSPNKEAEFGFPRPDFSRPPPSQPPPGPRSNDPRRRSTEEQQQQPFQAQKQSWNHQQQRNQEDIARGQREARINTDPRAMNPERRPQQRNEFDRFRGQRAVRGYEQEQQDCGEAAQDWSSSSWQDQRPPRGQPDQEEEGLFSRKPPQPPEIRDPRYNRPRQDEFHRQSEQYRSIRQQQEPPFGYQNQRSRPERQDQFQRKPQQQQDKAPAPWSQEAEQDQPRHGQYNQPQFGGSRPSASGSTPGASASPDYSQRSFQNRPAPSAASTASRNLQHYGSSAPPQSSNFPRETSQAYPSSSSTDMYSQQDQYRQRQQRDQPGRPAGAPTASAASSSSGVDSLNIDYKALLNTLKQFKQDEGQN